MKGRHCRFLRLGALLALKAVLPPLLAGQALIETESDISQLISDALLLNAEVTVQAPDGAGALWATRIDKITIPGRAVTVNLKGADSRLTVVFTLYTTDEEGLFLVARSESWIEGKYASALTSLPVAYGDAVFYYPLGRAGNGDEGNQMEVIMKISILPFWETLDVEDRKTLRDVFDSVAQFDLTEED